MCFQKPEKTTFCNLDLFKYNDWVDKNIKIYATNELGDFGGYFYIITVWYSDAIGVVLIARYRLIHETLSHQYFHIVYQY